MRNSPQSTIGGVRTVPGAGRRGASRVLVVVLLAALVLLAAGMIYVLAFPGAARPNPGAGGAATAANQKALAVAESAFREGEYGKAVRLLEDVIRQDAQDQEPRLLLAQAYCGLKQFADAYKQMEAAIAIGPAAPELHFDAGTIANQAGLAERALEHYAMAQTARPGEARYPLYLAMIQLKLGQTAPARASLVRAVTLSPELAEGWGTLAELELRENAPGLALDHARKARDLQKTVARWRIVEARALARQGDPRAAASVVMALDERERIKPEALAVLAQCFGLLEQPRDAAEAYALAGQARPDDGEVHYQAAAWFQRAGESALARKHARRARDLGHPQAEALLAGLPESP